MKLALEQIAALAHGVSYWEIREEQLWLHRLTREQEAFFASFDKTRIERAECPSGITLEFTTDSRSLSLALQVQELTGRRQAITVFADGKRVACTPIPLQPQAFIMNVDAELGEGEKTVVIRLPGITRTQILGMTIDDGARLSPVPERDTKLLLLGDSITQGYDAVNPEDAYAVRLSLALNAEVRNRAIGGDIFRPAYPLLRDDFEPDIVTVAYGTNDWSAFGATLPENCDGFYRNLKSTYPNARLYALLPLWRKDGDRTTDFGKLEDLNPAMRRVIEAIGGITVIDCFDFLHRDPAMLTDVVHPTAEGHALYATSLIPIVK